MAETRRLCRKHITTTELPQEVIFHDIIPRLPAKSLIHFLSVSKQWYVFLKSPMFANMHLNYVINDDQQNHYKLLVIYKNARCGFSNRDCETLKIGYRQRRPLPFKLSSGQDILIKSSCNRLVFVVLKKRILDNTLLDLILWNPLTGDYKTLSKSDLNLDSLYHTPFESYYNSSEEDSWRKINLKDAFQCIPNLTQSGWNPSTCWNKILYFAKRGSNYYSIIRFDTKTEKFHEDSNSLPPKLSVFLTHRSKRLYTHVCGGGVAHSKKSSAAYYVVQYEYKWSLEYGVKLYTGELFPYGSTAFDEGWELAHEVHTQLQ